VDVIPLHDTTRLSDGSIEYEWILDGARVTRVQPPPGFSFLNISSADGRRLGVEPADPPNDPGERSEWEARLRRMHVPPPPNDNLYRLRDVLGGERTAVASANNTVTSTNWGGIVAKPGGQVTEALMEYTIPLPHSIRRSRAPR
jgi:hypothetical protein